MMLGDDWNLYCTQLCMMSELWTEGNKKACDWTSCYKETWVDAESRRKSCGIYLMHGVRIKSILIRPVCARAGSSLGYNPKLSLIINWHSRGGKTLPAHSLIFVALP